MLSGLAEKFAEAGLLVSSNAKPMAWPDLILSGLVLYGLILYAACLAVTCLVPGLCACHGLFRFRLVLYAACLIPDPVWFGLV